jgi:hypothetical protein
MNKFTHLSKFVQKLFDDQDTVCQAKEIIEGILKARSPRLLKTLEKYQTGQSREIGAR